MHPCREYWGQDIAYGSLVTGERRRRGAFVHAQPEVYILDVDSDGAPGRHSGLAGLLQRLAGLDDGREETLRQSAVQLKQFLMSDALLQAGQSSVQERRFGVADTAGVRIMGIAAVRRDDGMLPPGSFAQVAGMPSTEAREQVSAQLCAEFMQRLGELGRRGEAAQIDWVVVRVGDAGVKSRSHLGAMRVSRVALQPFEPASAADAD